ncbi:MAG: hypothetical protein IJL92_08780 [Thermoguttaceae bacterium]|nr:hypothetical protein [Thermoguttaceae bacterium]
MANTITITSKQTPTIRALIKDSDGALFDYDDDLATVEELTAEGIDAKPASYTIRRSNNALAPYDVSISNSTPVEGYENVEIEESAFIDPATVEESELPYNFQVTPSSRAAFPFNDPGYYIVDFTLYPKEGAAIVFRVGVTVK